MNLQSEDDFKNLVRYFDNFFWYNDFYQCYEHSPDKTIYNYSHEFRHMWAPDRIRIILFMCENNLVGKPLEEIILLYRLTNETQTT